MRVAVVAPVPVPPATGGAERFTAGLAAAIGARPGCEADVIGRASPEHTLADLVASYRSFNALDLSSYDLVISSKYPAWMVRHPAHVVYLLHRLRGLYDRYPVPEEADELLGADAATRSLVATIDATIDAALDASGRLDSPSELAPVFDSVEAYLASRAPDDPVMAFPGPLARHFVQRLDELAFSPARILRYATISHGLVRRPGNFPPGVDVDVLYPPSDLVPAPAREPRHLFTASRLDHHKRVELLVDAMAFVTAPVDLVIAGSGPCEDALRRRAAGEPRIRFLGRVSDEALAAGYAEAIAVPFVPLDEDLGFITLEAMAAGKPVVTCVDSGGPTELVLDGVHGRVVAADPAELGAALDHLARSPADAARLGEAGRRRVARIGWSRVVERLLGPVAPAAPTGVGRTSRPRARVVMASTFPCFPPRTGGQLRVFHLACELATWVDVEVVCLTGQNQRAQRREVAPCVIETLVPKSAGHDALEARTEALVGMPVSDVAAAELIGHTPDYRQALRIAARRASGVIAVRPYLAAALSGVAPLLPMVYEAHDVELMAKDQLLPHSQEGDRLRGVVRDVEAAACASASVISTPSAADAESLAAAYGIPSSRFVLAPSGTDVTSIPFVPVAARMRAARQWLTSAFRDADRVPTAMTMFVGSWHLPNIRAAEALVDQVAHRGEVATVLVGSHTRGWQAATLPPNVRIVGLVSDRRLRTLMRAAQVAFNPMTEGSGTNVKMLDFLASGLPIVTTQIGARGLDVVDGEHVVVAPLPSMVDAATDLAADPVTAERLARAGRQLVLDRYSWDVALAPLIAAVRELIGS